jgi:hypothetical protein
MARTFEDKAKAKQLGKQGGTKSGESRRQRKRGAAYTGSILDVMDAAGLTGPTWAAWRVFLKAVFAVPMDDAELGIYRRHTERETAPLEPVREAWMPIGRRGGKTRIGAVVALYMAIRTDHAARLAPGETATIPALASDRKQARQVVKYLQGLCSLEAFAPFVDTSLKDSVVFRTGAVVEVATSSYRTVRGFTIVGLIADEIAFWRTDDGSANPDSEILTALRPGMATVPDALLLGLSSPYAARGELYKAVEQSFGQEDPHTLVWNADTRSMNPNVPPSVIERAFEDDPVAAASEYGQDGRVQFRRDVEAFLDAEAVRAVTVEGRRELAPMPARRYVGFVDPSGGSQDSFTLGIAHNEDGLAVLDALRERRPPFSPDEVVEEFAALLKTYRISAVTGDRYAGEWPRERFQRHGITYIPSTRTKSDIYREFLSPVNAGRVALLDLPILRAQLVGLERRVARGGNDSIDHAKGGRDDVANSAAGALVLLSPRAGTDMTGVTSLGSEVHAGPSQWTLGTGNLGGSYEGGFPGEPQPHPLNLDALSRRYGS